MNIYRGANISPTKNPLSIADGSVDTTMRHDVAEVAVPISAVDGIITVKPGDKRNIGQVIIRPIHQSITIFAVDMEFTRGS